MPQYKDIPIPPDPLRVRVEMSQDEAGELRVLAAGGAYPLAALCRVALSMLARGKTVTQESVMTELGRIRAEVAGPQEPPEPKRPRGRPRKTPLPNPAEPKRGRGRPKKEG